MSYSKIDIAGSWPDQFLRLDTDDLVGVVCAVSRKSNTQDVVLRVTTRCVDADGKTRQDANGHPIVTEFTHSTCDAEITVCGGIDGVTRQVIMLALGEPSTIPVIDEYKAHVSIRRALVSAGSTGGAALGDLL
jgi:hypothetical protein